MKNMGLVLLLVLLVVFLLFLFWSPSASSQKIIVEDDCRLTPKVSIVSAVAGAGQVTLNFIEIPNIVKYNIYVKKGNAVSKSDFSEKIEVPAGTNSHVITGLDNGIIVGVGITAVNECGESGLTSVLAYTL